MKTKDMLAFKQAWSLEEQAQQFCRKVPSKQSGASELLEAAYREWMQVLISTDGKNDAHKYFQKMFLVYGAVYDTSDFPLVSGKSYGTDKLFWTTVLQEIQVKTC